ncbi:MAG: GSCFA domain-containing protein [Methylocystis sp.]|uniref:GSCFA domain-containing protein n=1 Tax=Methylocystis sp. TaxID=1911079 RepID=UPI0039590B4B
MTSPYDNIEDHQLWRRAVSNVEPHLLNPVIEPKFKIDKSSIIGTAGSCFAQHIARKIREIGFSYFVPEKGEEFTVEERIRRNFGVFSARYGNIYTTRQLLQLFEEAFEQRNRYERAWIRSSDNRFVDPYRPQIEPEGFADIRSVAESRERHLEAVRAVFLQSEVLVFTLGLTETWRSKKDGSVFPLAPGVAGGSFDPELHEFLHLGVDEVSGDLCTFLKKLKERNPKIKVLLTVSPVPMIATFEKRHVLVSNTYTKSVLRVAAGIAVSRFDFVDYFPSYEIVTGSFAGGLYYEKSHREVNPLGVAHAMRCFLDSYLFRPSNVRSVSRMDELDDSANSQMSYEIVCDEEAIDAIKGGTSVDAS